MIVKTETEIEILREGGKKLASILYKTVSFVKEGARTNELNELTEKLIKEEKCAPSFKGYKTYSSQKAFPSALCVSVNDEVVHGIPSDRILKEGDLVGLDAGLVYQGFYLDMAITAPVGKIDDVSQKLLDVGKKALEKGILSAREGGFIGDISFAIQSYVESHGFKVVKELVGHGVGQAVHEEPEVPNWGEKRTGARLQKGIVLALEPMVTEGSPDVFLDRGNGWTYKTKDGKRAVHFEHTILINGNTAEILTKI